MSDVAYILPLFPKVSETFIVNEIDYMESSGFDVVPISIDRESELEGTTHAKAESLQKQTEYVMDYSALRFLVYLCFFLVRSPRRLATVCWLNWRLGELPDASRLGRLYKTVIIAKIVVDENVSHVHGHWTLPSNTALLASKLAGRTFSFTLHAHDIYDDLPLLAADTEFPTVEYKIECAEFIFTCTARNREFLMSEYGIPELKIQHVYHGVDLDQFDPSGESHEDDPPMILTVGRLVDYKGFDRVVDACGMLRDRGVEFQGQIVGDGAMYGDIRAQIQRLGLDDHVSMPGYVPHETVRDLYDRAAVYVFAGSHEQGHYGLPNVMVESAAMGVPIVTTWMPAVPELVEHETNGLVVDDRDPETFADAIERALDDDEFRRTLGENGRQKIQAQFALSKTLDPLVDTFHEHLDGERESTEAL